MKKNKKTQEGQRTPVGNDRGERWLASSPERRGQRQIVLAGSSLEAMALSRRLLDGLAPPRRPTRAAATGI